MVVRCTAALSLSMLVGLSTLLGYSQPMRSISAPKPMLKPPSPPREFRAAWVATVNNIDWPSKRGLPVAAQKSEIIAILDRAASLNLNAIVLQVRPACDALYPSKLEPWSEYLTGTMGKPPSPYYDPLQFWIEEAHKRGIELHCWFNPYRAHHPTGTSPISSDHVSRTNPEITKSYGSHLWLDPGEQGTQDHSIAVVMDVVNRYDCDAVQFDDYFYPYKEKDAAGNAIEFPDGPSWQKYRRKGGTMSREDWRRDNVNRFVERLYHEIKAAKPWVKLGISPFGIWRPGNPPQIKGMDPYSELYADARKWLKEGWVDYWSPQLYWPIGQTAQSYPVLLDWWRKQNTKGRNLWPGNYTSRVADGSKTAWPMDEIIQQIRTTREQAGATGNIHFSMVTLMRNSGLCNCLKKQVYTEKALVPASPWLDDATPSKPVVAMVEGERTAAWSPGREGKPWLWLIQLHTVSGWTNKIVPDGQRSIRLPDSDSKDSPDVIAVSAVDRCGVASDPSVLELTGN